jgi:hypothetical protein
MCQDYQRVKVQLLRLDDFDGARSEEMSRGFMMFNDFFLEPLACSEQSR